MGARIDQTVDHERNLTTVTVTGAVDADQVCRQILGFLGANPTSRVLWDLRSGTLSMLSATDMQRIITDCAEHADKRRGGRTAVLCARPVDFGLARMFETLAELYHVPFDIRVFGEHDEAMAWLFGVNSEERARV